MDGQFYCCFNSSFDSFTIVWKEIDSKTLITRIFLSDPELNSELKALKENNMIKKESSPSIELLGEQIRNQTDNNQLRIRT